jgi:hypothetical protein
MGMCVGEGLANFKAIKGLHSGGLINGLGSLPFLAS